MSAPETTPDAPTCLRCGGGDLQPGYLDDSASRGTYAQWYAGALDLNWAGDVKHWGERARFKVVALRCAQCGHLDLSAGEQV